MLPLIPPKSPFKFRFQVLFQIRLKYVLTWVRGVVNGRIEITCALRRDLGVVIYHVVVTSTSGMI